MPFPGVLRLILAVPLVLMTLLAPVQAQSRDDAIRDTIGRQFDAFRADDFAGAFEFASPNIQGIFGSADNFGAMVRNGYPMVWRPGSVQYLDLREEDGRLKQRVEIEDASGTVHYLDYEMIETEDGWKINGVAVVKQPGVSA